MLSATTTPRPVILQIDDLLDAVAAHLGRHGLRERQTRQ